MLAVRPMRHCGRAPGSARDTAGYSSSGALSRVSGRTLVPAANRCTTILIEQSVPDAGSRLHLRSHCDEVLDVEEVAHVSECTCLSSVQPVGDWKRVQEVVPVVTSLVQLADEVAKARHGSALGHRMQAVDERAQRVGVHVGRLDVAEDPCEVEADPRHTRCGVGGSAQLQQPSLVVGVSWIARMPRFRVVHVAHCPGEPRRSAA